MAKAPSATKSRSYKMSDEHKANLAAGREQSKVVRDYLAALQTNKPKRGRKRTQESIEKRVTLIDSTLATEENPLRRLTLISERDQLVGELERMQEGSTLDLTDLEAQFVKIAAEFSVRKGVSYHAWRETGVSAAVLKQAGISRSAA